VRKREGTDNTSDNNQQQEDEVGANHIWRTNKQTKKKKKHRHTETRAADNNKTIEAA
jgi:hypothetical protein